MPYCIMSHLIYAVLENIHLWNFCVPLALCHDLMLQHAIYFKSHNCKLCLNDKTLTILTVLPKATTNKIIFNKLRLHFSSRQMTGSPSLKQQ